MAAPIIGAIAFLGLAGGRELLRGRKDRRQRTTVQEATRSLLAPSRGRLEVGQQGPPLPTSDTEVSFNAQEQGAIEALMLGGMEQAGFNLAIATIDKRNALIDKNQDQAQAVSSATATLDQKRQEFVFDQQNEVRRIFEKNRDFAASQAELNRGAAVLNDPRAAQANAAALGQQAYSVKTPTGFEQVPMPGSTVFNAGEDRIAEGAALLADTNTARTETLQNRFSPNPQRGTTAAQRARATSILLRLKDVYGLGVLAGTDMELLLTTFPDAQSLEAFFTTNPEAVEQAMRVTSEQIALQLSNDMRRTRNWDMSVDPQAVRGQAAGALSSNAQLDRVSKAVIEAELERQQQAEAIGGNAFLDELGSGLGAAFPEAAARTRERQRLAQPSTLRALMGQGVAASLGLPEQIISGAVGFIGGRASGR